MNVLYPMGIIDPRNAEAVRCRVYGAEPDENDKARAAFVDRLAGEGVIDCPAYDPWIAKLQERGWLPERPELEPNPDGPGKIGRWRLTETGRREWATLKA